MKATSLSSISGNFLFVQSLENILDYEVSFLTCVTTLMASKLPLI